jgi:hypothetical protein
VHSAVEWAQGDAHGEEAEAAAWEVVGDDGVHGEEAILSAPHDPERRTPTGCTGPSHRVNTKWRLRSYGPRAMTNAETAGVHAVEKRPRIHPQDPGEVGRLRGSQQFSASFFTMAMRHSIHAKEPV